MHFSEAMKFSSILVKITKVDDLTDYMPEKGKELVNSDICVLSESYKSKYIRYHFFKDTCVQTLACIFLIPLSQFCNLF